MIYLFNSGSRPLYQENMLSTLFLPDGWTNEYRYNKRNVPPDFLDKNRKLEGVVEVLIVYVDRFGQDKAGKPIYTYYPVRKALFLSCKEESSQYYIRVQLMDYCYPKNTDSFNQMILRVTNSKLPMLKDVPENSDDGYYVLNAEPMKEIVFYDGEDAWNRSVEAISTNAQCFKSSNTNQYLFARAKLTADFPKGQRVRPLISNNHWFHDILRFLRLRKKVNDGISFYKLNINNSYCLNVNYVYPQQVADNAATAKLNLDFSDNIEPQGDSEIAVNARASRMQFSFLLKEPDKGRFENIKYRFSSEKDDVTLTASRRSFLIRAAYKKRYWFALIFIILLFAATSIVVGTDLAAGTTFKDYFTSTAGKTKIIAVIIQAIALLWLSKMSSKFSL